MNQKEKFLKGEGDSWFVRNRNYIGKNRDNLIPDMLKSIEISPKIVLEIGCGNGYWLNELREEYGCSCFGIDPSEQAIQDGNNNYSNITLIQGTADSLPFDDHYFDTVIFGFCLYLCDRRDLFKIACEADRVLKTEGVLIITDFYPNFPFKNKYSHQDGIYSYKMDYGRMFSWNPDYTEIAKVVYSHNGYKDRDVPDERVSTLFLSKNEEQAYVEGPYHNKS